MASLAGRLRGGEIVLSAWSALPEPLAAETMARVGFDAVTFDMQHGFHDGNSVLRGIGAVALAGRPAIVRVPVGRFDMASRALDFGAAAVIAPMINSASDARLFAAAMKFPPLGERSWGPHRAVALGGLGDPNAYLASANSETLALAMIETRAALRALDDILAVEGVDGVFVGPADLSLAWTQGGRVDARLADMMPAIADIAARAKAAGKLAAVYAVEPRDAARYHGMGFSLIATGSDTSFLTAGAGAALQAARGALSVG